MELLKYLAVFIFLISCSKEDTPSSTQYIIVSETNGNSDLLIYSTGSGDISEIVLKETVDTAKILDILLVPQGLFVILSNGIQLLNPLDWSVINSALHEFPEPSYIAYSKGKIYAAINENGSSYLRTYDENTLGLIESRLIGPVRVYALKVVKNRIFISYDKTVLVLDADEYGKVGEMELNNICTDLIVNSQNNVLVYYENRCSIINNSESKIANFILPGAKTLSTIASIPSVVLDRESDIIYYFQTQSGDSQLVLTSFDLRKNSPGRISPNYFAGEGIYFDQKSKHILLAEGVGVAGRVTVINVDGKLIESIDIPGKPVRIVSKFY